jgi:hypothetical protein
MNFFGFLSTPSLFLTSPNLTFSKFAHILLWAVTCSLEWGGMLWIDFRNWSKYRSSCLEGEFCILTCTIAMLQISFGLPCCSHLRIAAWLLVYSTDCFRYCLSIYISYAITVPVRPYGHTAYVHNPVKYIASSPFSTYCDMTSESRNSEVRIDVHC